MALTLTKVRFDGDRQFGLLDGTAELIVDVAFDSSYPTGGEVFDVSAYFAAVDTVLHIPSDAAVEGLAGDRIFAHDKGTAAAGLLLAYDEDNTSGIYAQIADMTDLSAVYTAARFKVTGTPLGTYSAASPTSSSNLGAY